MRHRVALELVRKPILLTHLVSLLASKITKQGVYKSRGYSNTERLTEAEIDLSIGTVGDAYDNALAECVIGLFKTEVINQIGPWKSMREVEWETLKWVDWYNNRRLLGPIGYITPAEAEEAFYANLNTLDMVAWSLNKSPSGKPGAVHNAGDPRAWITDPLAGIPGDTITKVDDLVVWRWTR